MRAPPLSAGCLQTQTAPAAAPHGRCRHDRAHDAYACRHDAGQRFYHGAPATADISRHAVCAAAQLAIG